MVFLNLSDAAQSWLAGALSLCFVLAYESWQYWHHRDSVHGRARKAHANLREAWLQAVSERPGSEILGVQTLRNSLMSATLTASTATLGLMGTVSLTASRWPGSEELAVSPRLAMELALMVALFVALACAVMAVRSFSHASFISAMPSGSTQQQQWLSVGIAHVRKAGELYSWSLRALLMTAPMVASIAHPWAGPVAAVALSFTLWRLDQVPTMPPASHA
jgi:Protein of unknown function, DUF599